MINQHLDPDLFLLFFWITFFNANLGDFLEPFGFFFGVVVAAAVALLLLVAECTIDERDEDEDVDLEESLAIEETDSGVSGDLGDFLVGDDLVLSIIVDGVFLES